MTQTAQPSRAGDVWGGLAAMLVALPSAIGYGLYAFQALGPSAAGQAALAGLLGAIALGLVAPVLGGAPRLITAPCGPAAAVLAAFGLQMVAAQHTTGEIVLGLVLIGFLAAMLQLAYGLAGGGRLIKYIPYPVVAGYLSGVGLLLFTGQVPKLLGLAAGADPWAGLIDPAAWRWPGVVIGLVTITGMVVGPRITRRVPGVIVGLAGGMFGYGVLATFLPELRSLDGNTDVIGPVGATYADLRGSFAGRWDAVAAVRFQDVSLIVAPAVTLSVLLSIDTLKTCVVVDALTRSRHDSNRELRAQGLGNLASALIGGMPGAGTMGATLVNLSSGGRTRLSGLLAGVFALIAFVLGCGFLPGVPSLIAWMPKAALAGVIMVVSVRMVDHHSLALLRDRSTVLDFVVIVAVVVTALTVSLLAASGVGLGLAVVLFIREQIRGSVVRHRIPGSRISSKRGRPPEQQAALDARADRTVVVKLQGTLFFGTTDQLFTLLANDIETCDHLVLDLRRVQAVDYTAAHMLAQIAETLGERGAQLAFASLPAAAPSGQDLEQYFVHLGLLSEHDNVHLFGELNSALAWIEERVLRETGFGDYHSASPLELAAFQLFADIAADDLAALAGVIEVRELASGDVLFHAGDTGDEIAFVRKGTLDVRLPLADGRFHVVATFSRGSFVGDIAFLDRGRRSADAVAVDPTSVFCLSRGRFDVFAAQHPAAAAALFARMATVLAGRLRRTDLELQALED